MWEYNNTDELYHYGVPGMRWGKRKNKEIRETRKEYHNLNRQIRRAGAKRIFSKSTYLAGHDNLEKDKAARKNIANLKNKRDQAAFKAIDARAKDAYNKKLARTGDVNKAERASIKVHYKAMKKDTHGRGRIGSVADVKTGSQQGKYYDHMVKTKGKEYANKVEKKYNNKTLRDLGGAVAIYAGTMYLLNKYK